MVDIQEESLLSLKGSTMTWNMSFKVQHEIFHHKKLLIFQHVFWLLSKLPE